MTYDESVRALFSLGRELAAPQQARVQKFGLENISILAEALGQPQRSAPCAHIAGTNGKGSTAAMLESILRAAGLRTGLYTSPHLERINERIRINDANISDNDFAAAWTHVHTTVEALMASGKLAAHPTFFECVTVMAFLAFAQETVEFAVYEVGLGGRLDATNIVVPEIAIITPVDFDHESYLGHSIEEIAAEKAGIIKPGAWVVSASERPEARAVIAKRCTEMDARLVELDATARLDEIQDWDGIYRAAAELTHSRKKLNLSPALPGRFQLRNALTAAIAARLLAERGFPIQDEAIERGIESAQWPGRLERLGTNPDTYLDGAHNPSGARELLKFWNEN
ncbi:MAG: folylpolyglutamate synthase/dihydrofolate synthase family protein, partial [Candidatus Acidiferrales bacterium]